MRDVMSNKSDHPHAQPKDAERQSDQPTIYQIRIEGHLDGQWATRFEQMTITLEEDGKTLLTGPVVDQAALHSLLRKVRDLGAPLVLSLIHISEPTRR